MSGGKGVPHPLWAHFKQTPERPEGHPCSSHRRQDHCIDPRASPHHVSSPHCLRKHKEQNILVYQRKSTHERKGTMMTRKRTHSARKRNARRPPPAIGRTPLESFDEAHGGDLLRISLCAAVPLWIWGLYERGGPEPRDFKEARAFGHTLAERGDRLIYRGERSGETAAMFNGLAKTLAVLAFLPGGGPALFGQGFDAGRILSGFIGEEAAGAYCQEIARRLQEEDS
jgi:hypothetical protein